MAEIEPDFAALVRAHTPQLLSVARAFAAGADEAEDLLQETWLVAHRDFSRRPPGAPVGAWLHVILLNVGRARWRRRRRRERLLAFWGGAARPHDGTNAPDVGDALLRARLWRDVAELPELQRRVLLHRVVDELSTAETAAALGRAEGTVKASLHRALAMLRSRWRPGEATSEGTNAMTLLRPEVTHD